MPSSAATVAFSPRSSERPARLAPPPAAAPEPAIVCREVVKHYYYYEHRTTSLRELFRRRVLRRPLHVRQPRFALSGLDLRVGHGEGVALLGRNGSGKSTVLRLLAGIYQPTSGEIEVRGRVGTVMELGSGFHPELTGTENVHLYGAMLGLGRREVAARYERILDFAGLGDFISMPVKYYSSGMQARLAFAVAVSVDPDILLLDEVLAVGDQGFRERCMERLRRFREEGGTLVAVSHDPEGIGELCERAVWLQDGRVRREGPMAEVAAAYAASARGEGGG
jgi:lipopolysaccharide transport system ATP-binding protein